MVHRLDQLAHHADGLWARVEVGASFSLFLLEDSLIKNGSRNDNYLDFSILETCEAFLPQLPFGLSASHWWYLRVFAGPGSTKIQERGRNRGV